MTIAIRRQSKPRRDPGFSLIELLVVLGILGLLAGFVAPKVVGYLSKAKSQTATTQIDSLRSTLDLFLLDTGRYPTAKAGLSALVTNDGRTPGWNGPYLGNGAVPVDPWGNAYLYALSDVGVPQITSLGADGATGGTGDAADIIR